MTYVQPLGELMEQKAVCVCACVHKCMCVSETSTGDTGVRIAARLPKDKNITSPNISSDSSALYCSL